MKVSFASPGSRLAWSRSRRAFSAPQQYKQKVLLLVLQRLLLPTLLLRECAPQQTSVDSKQPRCLHLIAASLVQRSRNRF